MQQTDMERIAQEVGKDFGYTEVHVEVHPHADVKVQWARTTEWVSFKMCDYFDNASEEVIRGLFEVSFARMRGYTIHPNKEYVEYLFSDEFIADNLPKFLERKKYVEDPVLTESINALDEELAYPTDGVKVYKGQGYAYSVLFKALVVPDDAEQDKTELARIIAEYTALRGLKTLGEPKNLGIDLESYKDNIFQML